MKIKGKGSAWVCVCGNRPELDGFYPCDMDGKEQEPDFSWEGFYLCAACGLVINQATLQAVGCGR